MILGLLAAPAAVLVLLASRRLPKVAVGARAGGWTSEFGTDPRSTSPAGLEVRP
jgi:hypothetical protein